MIKAKQVIFAVLALLVMQLAESVPVAGQEPSLLEGVDSVDARIRLTWDDDLQGLSEEVTRSRLQTVFELELRTFGTRIAATARNYLDIAFVLLDTGTGAVAYYYSIDLKEPAYTRRKVLDWMIKAGESGEGAFDAFVAQWGLSRADWLPTWQGGRGVGFVGRSNLQDALERNVRELAQEFVNERLAAGS